MGILNPVKWITLITIPAFNFKDGISGSPGWPSASYIAEDGLDLPVLWSPFPSAGITGTTHLSAVVFYCVF